MEISAEQVYRWRKDPVTLRIQEYIKSMISEREAAVTYGDLFFSPDSEKKTAQLYGQMDSLRFILNLSTAELVEEDDD